MAELQNSMPLGWDCKLDENSGKYYYINHYTKTTTWEDPRYRHRPSHTNRKPIPTEHIPLQQCSSDSRRNYVYPSQTSPIPAFQIPAHMSPKNVHLQDMKPKMSPLTVRNAKVQDTSLSSAVDTDETVAKISAMFPTVSETHIRILMKKYNSREALVISALQVEKHPITTPGPFATPPPQRNIHHPLHVTPPLAFRANSRGGSPVFRPGLGTNSTHTGSPRIGDGYHTSPRPHSSPKLKLSCRYMKSIFPNADETVILEILQNNENNIQKTSESLREMGYSKKDTVKIAQQKMEAKKEEERKDNEKKNTPPSTIQPKIKSAEEKEKLIKDTQAKYKDVAEHLIVIALESVNFDENRADQILKIMIQEDTKVEETKSNVEAAAVRDVLDTPSTSKTYPIPVSQSRQSIKSLLKSEKDIEKVSYTRIIEENDKRYQSQNLSSTTGHNPDYAKGPNENLLLEDYIKWQGGNPNLRKGPQGIACGPNKNFLAKRIFQVCGSNKDLSRGPQIGLAKGSMFGQMKTLVIGESRVK